MLALRLPHIRKQDSGSSSTANYAEATKSYRRIYAIGDIHGRSDLLDKISEKIRSDLGDSGGEDCLTVTLGDYVDRGPDSRGVLDRLVRNPFPTPYVGLKGNHEELLEDFLQQPVIGAHLRQLGGMETLHSYGVPVKALMTGRGRELEMTLYEEASRALGAVIPKEHLEFMANLRTSLTLENYFFCHAGIRPGVPFERQTDEDLLWIRDVFLKSTMNFGKLVIHGHTPNEQPEVRPNRINVDTGAYATGCLTCLVLDGSKRRFLSTKP